jgi:Tfp pilus assembly protein PilV
MSDLVRRPSRRRRRGADVGATLTELLIAIVLLGIIMTSLSAAVLVIVKQRANTSGRLTNARSEQNLNIWLPADLASAETVDTAADASPCGSSCPATADTRGSNAAMLSWTSMQAGATAAQPVTINVSYRYMQVSGAYQLSRVECSSVAAGPWTCSTTVVLHDMPAPPTGTFVAGVDRPTWAVDVHEPLDPAAIDPDAAPQDPGLNVKNATRVVVTVNGGGAAVNAGGDSQMTFSAGGTDRDTITADSVTGAPTFTEARSRCGGNYGLVIDTSGSIGATAMSSVVAGISSFIDAFAGTPLKLQLVPFNTTSWTLGAPTWGKYYDMLVPADVTAAKRAVAGLRSGGSTNWEDAVFRMFRNADGTVQSVLPDKVIFFTDGVPTVSRLNSSSSRAATTPPGRLTGMPRIGPSGFNQEAWYRADYLLDQFRPTTDVIGVGVGPAIDPASPAATRQSEWWNGTAQVNTENSVILSRFITGNDTGVPAQMSGGVYTNAEQANMYILPRWSQFAGALQAVALAECGGTVTLQTQVAGTPAADPFTYQNTKITNAAGVDLPSPLTVVTTSSTYVSGTFDFDIPNGQYLDVTFEPQIDSGLSAYRQVGWRCSAGGVARTGTPVPVASSTWTGVRVRVAANEAVSCVLDVERV